ncbi:hypothetical protein GCM10010129_79080 [Streptomyces fumigatiscleroticus]|nr:hypothetical protein GCM10010129_79080 [Streptomyces fumigatiscleroticus]
MDAVLERLAVRNRLHGGRARFGRRAGALVVQIEGDDGSWLPGWLDRCRGVLPVGVADAAEPGPDEDQQVVAQLRTMTDGCGFQGRPPYALPVVFPRFAAARTALYAWRPGDGQNQHEQLNDLMSTLKEAIAQAKRLTLPTAKRHMATALGTPHVAALVSGVVGAVLDLVHVVRFPHRRAMRWFRHAVNTRTDAETCLALWLRWARWTPERKQELLVDALLADIEAHYGLFRRLNRVRRPVFFLPDVDTCPARGTVRDRLLAAYNGESKELRAYPVVITTCRPDAATPPDGARPAVPPDRLAHEIPARFSERRQVAKRRAEGFDEPLPSRVVRVALQSAPAQQPQRSQRLRQSQEPQEPQRPAAPGSRP